MIKKISFLFLFLSAGYLLQAQIRYFVQADGNLSILPKIRQHSSFMDEMAPVPTTVTVKSSTNFESKIGGAVKAGVQIPLSDKLLVETLLEGSLISYRQKNKIQMTSVSGTTITQSNTTSYASGHPVAGYWGPGIIFGPNPVLVPGTTSGDPDKTGIVNSWYGSLQGKLKYRLLPGTSLGAGAGLYGLLAVTSYRNTVTPELVSNSSGDVWVLHTKVVKEHAKDAFETFGALATLSVEQAITKQFSLEATITQHLSKLYKDATQSTEGGKAKVRYISLGARYYFH